jgi:uncharacterized membrane protein
MRGLGMVLRLGVIAAAAVVALGAILYLAADGLTHPDYHTFEAHASKLHGGRAVIQAGVLLLIATPIARVAGAALLFARQRDFCYVAVSLVVFAALMYSLLLTH